MSCGTFAKFIAKSLPFLRQPKRRTVRHRTNGRACYSVRHALQEASEYLDQQHHTQWPNSRTPITQLLH